LYQGLKSLASLNKRLSKNSGEWKQYDLAHPNCGGDVRIKINPATPYSYYDLQLWNASRLKAEELAYPVVPLVIKPESPQQAKAAWKKLKTIIVHAERPT
jgi:hypothetical protein